MQPVSDQVGAGLARRARGRDAATQHLDLRSLHCASTCVPVSVRTLCKIVQGTDMHVDTTASALHMPQHTCAQA
eukprot:12882099-Alexandrium_andersonii.AAC.1